MNNLVWLQTLIYKEVSRVFRIWKQTLLPPVITATLYFIVFWKFLWGKIDTIQGVPYINFILPGLILMSVLTSSYSNTVSSFFWAKFQKSIEEILVSPMPKVYVLLWYVLGWVIRGILVWILVLAVALFFTNISIFSMHYLIWFLVVTAILFSLAWFMNALFAKSFDDVNFIPTFVITPLTYLGWVFYSISLLSWFWQTLNRFNPILYMINWFRYWFLGISDVNVDLAFYIILWIALALFFINWYLLKKWYKLKT